jgi:hypothetical protein
MRATKLAFRAAQALCLFCLHIVILSLSKHTCGARLTPLFSSLAFLAFSPFCLREVPNIGNAHDLSQLLL